MNIRLYRIAWRGLEGELTGTIVSTDWQGGNGIANDQFVKVMVDGGQRVIHTVYKRDVLDLGELDPSYGNKPQNDSRWRMTNWGNAPRRVSPPVPIVGTMPWTPGGAI